MKTASQENIRHQISKVKFLIKMYVRTLLGREVRIETEDRRVMEEVIFPYYLSRTDIQKVLFVGCAPYTAHYPKIWAGIEYWTIDIDPRQKRFGSRNHIVDSVGSLGKHFRPGYFDLIFFNGVYGYGVNTKALCEQAFQACYEALKEGGEFLMGWNQLPQYAPVPLEDIKALAQFQPKAFAPLSSSRYVCDQHMFHTYDFYIKPAGTKDKL